MSIFSLQGKIAVVTGTASGLGQGMAIGLAEAGADLVVTTNRNSPDATIEAIESLGREVLHVPLDLGKEENIPVLINKVLSKFGRIDILVNNAGIIRRTPAVDHAAEDWHDVIRVNQDAMFFLCQQAGRQMIKQGSGKIINVASLLTFQGGTTVPGYAASKHAVAGLTKALANEWASKGINVNAIAPGYMETDNTQALRENKERSRQILERIPADRWGSPEDMKGAAVFLASSASDYVNGHILLVDGGWMAR